MGDRLIEEAENDPSIKLSDSPQKEEDEQLTASYGQNKLSQLFQKMTKS